jgi:DNA-binding NtrC family response regulator
VNILVTDDDPIVLRSCERILEAEGHSVKSTGNTDDALAALEDQPFDLVLIDVVMELKDGVYLIERVRERWKDLPVILMSGYSTPETISRGMKAGASQFIPKPFTPDELIAVIEKIDFRKHEGEKNG